MRLASCDSHFAGLWRSVDLVSVQTASDYHQTALRMDEKTSTCRMPQRAWYSGALLALTPLIHHVLNDARLFPENENLPVSLWVVLIVSLVQLVLVVIVIGAAAWLCRRLRKWDWFCRGTLTIAILALSGSLACRFADPPSPATYFQKVFASKLPDSAHQVRVLGTTPADSNVWFYFRSTPQELEKLAQSMRLSEPKPIQSLIMGMTPPRGWPDYSSWTRASASWIRNGDTGRIDYFITDSTGQCYVYKDPLASKTDAELRGDYSK